MLLTDQEREKFAAYLEQNARDNELLVKQMKKLPFASQQTIWEMLCKDAAAYIRVAAKLRAVEDCSIVATEAGGE